MVDGGVEIRQRHGVKVLAVMCSAGGLETGSTMAGGKETMKDHMHRSTATTAAVLHDHRVPC
jgi:hypothetical protein